jgi:hypothetical protein
MSGPVSSVGSGSGAWAGCDEEARVCYQTTPPKTTDTTASPPTDTCESSHPPIVCSDPDVDPLAGPDDEWDNDRYNNGKGPLVDRQAQEAHYEGCIDAAATRRNECHGRVEREAEKLCSTDNKGQGRFPDGRPVAPGQEQVCKDETVYGRRERTTTEQTQGAKTYGNKTASEASREISGEREVPIVGGKVAGKTGSKESGEVSYQESDAQQRGESVRYESHKGLAAECQARYEAERSRCIMP